MRDRVAGRRESNLPPLFFARLAANALAVGWRDQRILTEQIEVAATRSVDRHRQAFHNGW